MRNKNILYVSGFFGNLFFERGIWILYLLSIQFSLFQIGILQAILNFTMFVFEVPFGYLSDKIGRKRVLILGHSFIVLYLTTFLVFDEFWLLALGHVFYGIGLTLISGTDEAFLYDSLKSEKVESSYSKVIGLYNAIIIVSVGLATAAGGLLEGFSWSYVFIGGIIAQMCALISVLFLRDLDMKKLDMDENDEEDGLSVKETFIQFFKLNKSLKFFIISVSVFFAITSVFYMFSQEMFDSKNLSILEISLLYGAIAIFQAIASIFAHRLEEFSSSKKVLLSCFVLVGMLYPLIILNDIWIIVVAFVFISILYEIVDPISSTIVNKEIPSRIRATILSLISLVTSLIMFIAFPLVGLISDYIDSSLVLAILGVISISVSVISLVTFYKSKDVAEKLERNDADVI